jgi:succinate dehydrogenase/fumarate reductase cytochrome b subunit
MDKQCLYPENAFFISGEYSKPINYEEINNSFMKKYHVTRMRAIFRIPLALLLLVVAFGIFFGIVVMIRVSIVEWGSWLITICYMIWIFGLILALYFFFVSAWELLFPKFKKVKSDWQELFDKGSFVIGNVKSKKITGSSTITIGYTFKAKDGVEGNGQYEVSNVFELKSDQVLVWYVDENIHTLL